MTIDTFFDYEELDRNARPGAFSTLDMEVLVPEVAKLVPGDIYLEVGVDKGKSLSVARMVAKEKVKVIGVDLKVDPQVKGTVFYQGDSVEVAKIYNDGLISVLFIDGDHSYLGVKRDIDAWYPHVKEHGVILFHDCDESSPGVMWAVSEFVYTHDCGFFLYKYNNKNTSMARVLL
ncbi:MAG: hypothetical protein A2Y53_03695 [Chloroflexi bacterium RBG_16_47_49]|nr:MAG: hypothetical protein A2Y53_03695 [Chloroflexi bacterium RBG_16_47_49]